LQITLTQIGIACLIAAVVGGGFKVFTIDWPLISLKRQFLLALLGAIFIASEHPDEVTQAIEAGKTIFSRDAATTRVSTDSVSSKQVSRTAANSGTPTVTTNSPPADDALVSGQDAAPAAPAAAAAGAQALPQTIEEFIRSFKVPD
jgi:hypothetical protein